MVGRRPRNSRGGAFVHLGIGVGERVDIATRGQTDMRGLVTAGRLFGRSVSTCLKPGMARFTVQVAGLPHSALVGHSSRLSPNLISAQMKF